MKHTAVYIALVLGIAFVPGVQAADRDTLKERLRSIGAVEITQTGIVSNTAVRRSQTAPAAIEPSVTSAPRATAIPSATTIPTSVPPTNTPSATLEPTQQPVLSPLPLGDVEATQSADTKDPVSPTAEPPFQPTETPLPESPTQIPTATSAPTNTPPARSNQEERLQPPNFDSDDIVISVEFSKAGPDDVNTLISTAEELAREKQVFMYDFKRAATVFLFVKDSKEKLSEVAEKLYYADGVYVSGNRKYNASFSPNDTFYSSQWNLSKIEYGSALFYSQGTEDITVAVMDNGVNTTEPDLDGKLWVNTGETAGNGVDDDGNGYIDDRYGCNFYQHHTLNNTTTACSASSINSTGHGKNVASIIGAEISNNYGIAGICPRCRIMVLDVDDTGGASLSNIIFAINYAVDNGADVINFSYSSACPFNASEDVLANTLNNLINTDGVMFVQAASNYGSRTTTECNSECSGNTFCSSSAKNESYYYVDGKNVENNIIVAATTQSDARASFSSYDGSNQVIDIAAPGQGIPVSAASLTTVNGTSFAAPHVTAALGYVLSITKSTVNPSPSTLVNYLVSTADKITTDKDISGKRLNLYRLYQLMNAKKNVSGTSYMFITRFYSSALASHFFTGSESEFSYIMNTFPDSVWRFEYIAYYAYATQQADTYPVYRFWSPVFGAHFYTISEAEKNYVINSLNNFWNYEGIAWYAYPSDEAGQIPVFRFWSDQYGKHFYTTSVAERDYLINSFDDRVWRYEGESWSVPSVN